MGLFAFFGWLGLIRFSVSGCLSTLQLICRHFHTQLSSDGVQCRSPVRFEQPREFTVVTDSEASPASEELGHLDSLLQVVSVACLESVSDLFLAEAFALSDDLASVMVQRSATSASHLSDLVHILRHKANDDEAVGPESNVGSAAICLKGEDDSTDLLPDDSDDRLERQVIWGGHNGDGFLL